MTDKERIAQLEANLDAIGTLARLVWNDMQGRLVDDQHRRAHKALGRIAQQASNALQTTEPV